MGVFLAVYAMSFLGYLFHLTLSDVKRTTGEKVELFLLYQIVFNIGILSLMSFCALIIMPEFVASTLDWPTCPFQHELANVNLAFAVLGFMCIWWRGNFWVATVIGVAIWLIGDGIGHVWHLVYHQNNSDGNAGVPLYTDFTIPIVLLIGLYFYLKYQPTIARQ